MGSEAVGVMVVVSGVCCADVGSGEPVVSLWVMLGEMIGPSLDESVMVVADVCIFSIGCDMMVGSERMVTESVFRIVAPL